MVNLESLDIKLGMEDFEIACELLNRLKCQNNLTLLMCFVIVLFGHMLYSSADTDQKWLFVLTENICISAAYKSPWAMSLEIIPMQHFTS